MHIQDTLKNIFDSQAKLQRESFGVDPHLLDPVARSEYIAMMILALQDELHEALAECGWKPWASSRHLNQLAFGAELVDALHFLVNLFLAAGWSSDDVADGYKKKAAINAARQKKGYDGVQNKCATCKRALDDPAVECTSTRCSTMQ